MRRPRWLYRLHAFLFRYFWLPCPLCGRYFSGWEWGRGTGEDTIPRNSTGGGRGICPGCQTAGRGRTDFSGLDPRL